MKKNIAFKIMLFSSLILINSCSNDEVIQSEHETTKLDNFDNYSKSLEVISESNLETLKADALRDYDNYDFSLLISPNSNATDYDLIISSLSPYEDEEINYKTILGQNYDNAYFNELASIYSFGEVIVNSNLFNKNTTLEDREPYLKEVLEYVLLNNLEDQIEGSNCQGHLNVCQNGAERTLGISIAGCTALAVVGGIFTGGVGAASWPVCMATAGFHYDSNIQTCHEHYELCLNE